MFLFFGLLIILSRFYFLCPETTATKLPMLCLITILKLPTQCVVKSNWWIPATVITCQVLGCSVLTLYWSVGAGDSCVCTCSHSAV